jgi:hypothetical protein
VNIIGSVTGAVHKDAGPNFALGGIGPARGGIGIGGAGDQAEPDRATDALMAVVVLLASHA